MDETKLLQGLQNRDPESYREIVDLYSPRIYRLAYGITQDPMEAQDITQDVLLTVFRRVEEFHGRSSILTWMYRIAVNASLDRVRSRQRKRDTVSIEEFLPVFSSEGKFAEPVEDWSGAPLEHLLGREARRKIMEAIEALPEDLKIVLVMKDVEGIQLKEICEIMELSLPAVKSRLHRARLALRGFLTAYFQDKVGGKSHERTG